MKIRTGHAQAGSLITGDSSTFVSAQKTFDTMEDYTVTVDVDLPTSRVTAFVTATVRWTVKGVTVTRTYDVATTATFSGIAEALTITVNDATPAPHPQGVSYNASILIAIGTKAVASAGPVGGVGWQVGAPTQSVVQAQNVSAAGPPPPPPLDVSIVDILVGFALPQGDLAVGYASPGGVYTGVTSGCSFTAPANGHTCTGVRFYRGDTHPVRVTLWQQGVGAIATATGVGNGGTATILFAAAVALTPGALYCVTVFDTTPPTLNFALAPTYWSADEIASVIPRIPQGVGNSSVLWSAGAMGVDFFNNPGTSQFECYLCWFENSSNWGYGQPDQTSTNVLFPVEPVVT